VITASDVMINALGRCPGNGKVFPDGSKVVKIEWSFKKNTVDPYFVKRAGYFDDGCNTTRFPNTLIGIRPVGL